MLMMGKKIIEELAGAKSPKPLKLTVSDHGVEVHVELEDFDRLGCLLKGVEIFMEESCEDRIEAQSNNIMDKITYLIDRFKVVELDNFNHQVLLRSEKPLTYDNSLLYDEIIIQKGNHLKLHRVCFDVGKREQMEAHSNISLDLLAKLITDLTSCMCSTA